MDSRVLTREDIQMAMDASGKASVGAFSMMEYIEYLEDEVERVKEQRDTYRDQVDDSREEHLVAARALSGIRRIADGLGIAFETALRDRAHLIDAVARVRGTIDQWREEVKFKTARILELENELANASRKIPTVRGQMVSTWTVVVAGVPGGGIASKLHGLAIQGRATKPTRVYIRDYKAAVFSVIGWDEMSVVVKNVTQTTSGCQVVCEWDAGGDDAVAT